MKYRQKVIPIVTSPKTWENASANELRYLVKSWYSKHLQGKEVTNKHLGLKIKFTSQGKNKVSGGGVIYLYKAVAVMALKEVMENAEFSNFSAPKRTDPTEMLGYFNFKCKVKIDGKLRHLRIATLFYQKEGKLFYSLEVNKY